MDSDTALSADAIIASVAISHIDAPYAENARRQWDDLRDRLPMLSRDAHDILESDSECRAEFGMSYVCGGGQYGDVGAAYAQFGATDRQRDLVAEADRTLRERFDLHVSERDLDMALIPLGVPLSDPDDIPF
jgi:hypothetical protein